MKPFFFVALAVTSFACSSSEVSQTPAPGPTFPLQGVWAVVEGNINDIKNDPNGVDRIDPDTGKVVAKIVAKEPTDGTTLHYAPVDIAFCMGGVWAGHKNLDRIDPRSHSIVSVVTGGAVLSQACGHDSLWAVVSSSEPAIEQYDVDGKQLQRIVFGQPTPIDVRTSKAAVWVFDQAKRIQRLDPSTYQRSVLALQQGGKSYHALGVGTNGQDVYVVGDDGNAQAILQLEDSSGAIVAAVPIVFATKLNFGNSPRVVVGFDSLWTCTSKLTRMHLATGAVDLIDGVGDCSDVEIGLGKVWVSDKKASSVVTVDPASNAVTATFATGYNPRALAISE